MGRFAGLWTYGGAASLALTTAPVPMTLWTLASDGPGVDASLADDGLHIKVPGFYAAYATMSFTADAGETIYAELRVNGLTGSGFRISAEGIASGGTVSMLVMGAANLNVGDVVQVYVYSDNVATTFTLVDGQFGVFGL